MLALTTPIHFHIPQKPISRLNIPSIFTRKRAGIGKKAAGFDGFVGGRSDLFGFVEVGRKFWEGSWCCRCKERWESEGDSELEEEILEFMEKSAKPGAFPSKKELVEAGRLDLVEAIKNRGGWLSLGWEPEDEGNEEQKVKEDEVLKIEFDIKEFQRRVESCKESGSLGKNEAGSWPSSSSSARSSPTSEEYSVSSNRSASSSGSSLEIGVEEDTGINGILSRLEKERSSSFGGNNNHYAKPDTWRSWSLHRAGFKNTEFEAAEISYNKNRIENKGEASKDEIIAVAADATAKAVDKWKTTNSAHIQTHIQHLELELASALHSLRSKREETNSKEVLANSSSDLQALSDALEFQENELMSSQERLRSIHAKLAVLEGKMALAIIDAQKILEEKQIRIDSACKTLELLRTACVVWPNSASEVLLAGSYDGWTTQRKMENLRGVFSVCLKLYPGKYEIKFIVDGKWRVDPLRPIVNNNGHENNVLIIT